MRVLQYIGLGSNKYGGLEKYLIELSQQLQNNGDIVSIVYKRGITSKLFKSSLNEHGVVYYSLAGKKSFCQLFKSIGSIVRSEKPDIIHLNFANSIECLFFLIQGKRYNKQIHIVYTYHCQPSIDSLRHWISNAVIVYSSRLVLCVSQASAKELSNHFKHKAFRTLYLGVPLKTRGMSSFRRELGVPNEKKIITNIAYHDPIKGIDILVNAVDYLVNTLAYKNLLVLQIGFNAVPEYSETVQRMVVEKGLQDYFRFLGFREDVPDILSASDIYCQPSRSEGVPLSIMEACISMLPVVATDVGGNSEAVINNKTGYLCEPEGYISIANCLHDLLENDSRRHDFGNAGYELAKDLFSIEASVKSLISYYYSC